MQQGTAMLAQTPEILRQETRSKTSPILILMLVVLAATPFISQYLQHSLRVFMGLLFRYAREDRMVELEAIRLWHTRCPRTRGHSTPQRVSALKPGSRYTDTSFDRWLRLVFSALYLHWRCLRLGVGRQQSSQVPVCGSNVPGDPLGMGANCASGFSKIVNTIAGYLRPPWPLRAAICA